MKTAATAFLFLVSTGLMACSSSGTMRSTFVTDSAGIRRMNDSIRQESRKETERAYKAQSDSQPFVEVVSARLDTVNGTQNATVEIRNTSDKADDDVEGILLLLVLQNRFGEPALQTHTVMNFPDVLLIHGKSRTISMALKTGDAAKITASVLAINFIDDTYWVNTGKKQPFRTRRRGRWK